jgi:hypothetical protein
MMLVPTTYAVRVLVAIGMIVAGAWLVGFCVTSGGLDATVSDDGGRTKGVLEGVSGAVVISSVPLVVVGGTLGVSVAVGPSDVGIALSVGIAESEFVSPVPVGRRVSELVTPVPIGAETPEVVGPVPVGAEMPELVSGVPVETGSEVGMSVPENSDVGIPLSVGVGTPVGSVVTPVPDGIPDVPVGGIIPEVVPGTSVGTVVASDDSRLDKRLLIGMGMGPVPVGKMPLEISEASSEPTLDTTLGMSGRPVESWLRPEVRPDRRLDNSETTGDSVSAVVPDAVGTAVWSLEPPVRLGMTPVGSKVSDGS